MVRLLLPPALTTLELGLLWCSLVVGSYLVLPTTEDAAPDPSSAATPSSDAIAAAPVAAAAPTAGGGLMQGTRCGPLVQEEQEEEEGEGVEGQEVAQAGLEVGQIHVMGADIAAAAAVRAAAEADAGEAAEAGAAATVAAEVGAKEAAEGEDMHGAEAGGQCQWGAKDAKPAMQPVLTRPHTPAYDVTAARPTATGTPPYPPTPQFLLGDPGAPPLPSNHLPPSPPMHRVQLLGLVPQKEDPPPPLHLASGQEQHPSTQGGTQTAMRDGTPESELAMRDTRPTPLWSMGGGGRLLRRQPGRLVLRRELEGVEQGWQGQQQGQTVPWGHQLRQAGEEGIWNGRGEAERGGDQLVMQQDTQQHTQQHTQQDTQLDMQQGAQQGAQYTSGVKRMLERPISPQRQMLPTGMVPTPQGRPPPCSTLAPAMGGMGAMRPAWPTPWLHEPGLREQAPQWRLEGRGQGDQDDGEGEAIGPEVVGQAPPGPHPRQQQQQEVQQQKVQQQELQRQREQQQEQLQSLQQGLRHCQRMRAWRLRRRGCMRGAEQSTDDRDGREGEGRRGRLRVGEVDQECDSLGLGPTFGLRPGLAHNTGLRRVGAGSRGHEVGHGPSGGLGLDGAIGTGTAAGGTRDGVEGCPMQRRAERGRRVGSQGAAGGAMDVSGGDLIDMLAAVCVERGMGKLRSVGWDGADAQEEREGCESPPGLHHADEPTCSSGSLFTGITEGVDARRPGPLAAAGLCITAAIFDACFHLSIPSDIVALLHGLPLTSLTLNNAMPVLDEELAVVTRLTSLTSLSLSGINLITVSLMQSAVCVGQSVEAWLMMGQHDEAAWWGPGSSAAVSQSLVNLVPTAGRTHCWSTLVVCCLGCCLGFGL